MDGQSLQDKLDWLSRHTRYLKDDVLLGVQQELGDARGRTLQAIGKQLGEIQKLFDTALEQASSI